MTYFYFKGSGFSAEDEAYCRVKELEHPEGPIVEHLVNGKWLTSAWSRERAADFEDLFSMDEFLRGRVQIDYCEIPE